MNQAVEQRRTWSIAKPLRIGLSALIFFVAVIGIWGVQTNITGAVLGTGKVQVSSIRTAIQHPDGGVVAEMLVENGSKVSAGDVIVRLDDVQLRSNLKVVESELFESLANSARLKAIIDDAPDLILDPLLEDQLQHDAGVAPLLDRQRRQLLSHYESTAAARRTLQMQIREIGNQIAGAEAEYASKVEKLAFVQSEIVRLGDAHERGLMPKNELQNMTKERIDTDGEIARLEAGIAALKSTQLDIELKAHELLPAIKEKADNDLNLSQRDSGTLLAKRDALLDELNRLDIRAPMDGTIHDARIEGIRSVVIAGRPLMYVVPDHRPVSVAARINAGDIDEVALGQSAILKFTAFDARTLPNIYGEVSKVSADAFLDPLTKKSYYDVEIQLSDEEIEKLGENQLIAGMPVSVYLTTSERSPVDYVMRPLSQYIDRAFRD